MFNFTNIMFELKKNNYSFIYNTLNYKEYFKIFIFLQEKFYRVQ